MICREDKPLAVIGMARDITARKQAEEAHLARKRELKSKTRDLADANVALQVLLKKRAADKQALEKRMLSKPYG